MAESKKGGLVDLEKELTCSVSELLQKGLRLCSRLPVSKHAYGRDLKQYRQLHHCSYSEEDSGLGD